MVFGTALGAFALDVAVGQEHLLRGIVELLDLARGDVLVFELVIERFGELLVLAGVGGVVVVERDVEFLEIALMAFEEAGDELLRFHPGLLGGEHDRRAVGVVGADVGHLVTLHALEAHPDIGLDVAH